MLTRSHRAPFCGQAIASESTELIEAKSDKHLGLSLSTANRRHLEPTRAARWPAHVTSGPQYFSIDIFVLLKILRQ
jgi:hypothetical protein